MDVVVIFNGLGNQLSQYSFYLAKQKYCKNCTCIFDSRGVNNHNGFELNRLFGIEIPNTIKNRILYWLFQLKKRKIVSSLLSLLKIRIIKEDNKYLFNEDLLVKSPLGINFYWGGWPSEKHFKAIEKEVKGTFSFPNSEEDEVFNKMKTEIEKNPTSVSLHIRRGDYLKKTNSIYQFGGVATDDYFKKAIQYTIKHINNPSFYVFSDDINWCREHFIGNEYHFVDCNNGLNSWRDLYLMSLCRHHINSNSTFSWWGAWLCEYDDKIVITPEEYIKDLSTPDVYPADWIKL